MPVFLPRRQINRLVSDSVHKNVRLLAFPKTSDVMLPLLNFLFFARNLQKLLNRLNYLQKI